jgi:two-component system, response regulator PdtaR
MPPAPHILIAGEDPIITNLISSMLQKKGFGMLGTVTTGQEVIAKTVEQAPDLVLMDTQLAGQIDAVDAAHYIFQLFHVPVVIITGMTEEEKLARIKLAKPYGIVFKPFTAVQVITVVDLGLYLHADRAKTLGNSPVGDSRKMKDSAEEAVVILDKRGRIIYLNTYATWIVDSLSPQAFMRPWRDIMMFVSDSTGEEIDDPVTGATKNMAGSIYDASTSVVTTTSKRRKVSLAIRPIRDDHDRLIASVMTMKENLKTYM